MLAFFEPIFYLTRLNSLNTRSNICKRSLLTCFLDSFDSFLIFGHFSVFERGWIFILTMVYNLTSQLSILETSENVVILIYRCKTFHKVYLLNCNYASLHLRRERPQERCGLVLVSEQNFFLAI